MSGPRTARDAAYQAYNAAARAIPDCPHNQAWWQEGPGRPQPPDCEHNRPWRAAIDAAWDTFIAAIDAEDAAKGPAARQPAPPPLLVQDALW